MEKIPNAKSHENINKEDERDFLSRRNFMVGAGAAAVAAGTSSVAKANVESSPQPLRRPVNEASDIENNEDYTEQLKALSYEAYEAPNEKALRFANTLHNDLGIVVDRMSSLVEDNENYSSILHLIHQELDLSNIPESVSAPLREFMIYLPYVESRFDNQAVSSQRAFGLMQLMPSAWEELSRDSENQNNIVDQVKVAGRLLEQTYRHIMNEHRATLEFVAELLFEGDVERCDREFVCPLVVNGYFSGMGTITQVLDGFYEDYLNETEKLRMTENNILTDEMGVYGIFSTAGEMHGYSRWYGEESGKYVPKILAAKLVIRTGLPPTLLAELVPGFSDEEIRS